MPHFRNHKNTIDFGKITITPKGIRRIRIGEYSILPYVTMSKIRFTLHVEKLPQQDGINRNNRNVYMQLGDGSYRAIKTICANETDIEGIAEYTGDTKFFIAPANYFFKNSERFIAQEGILLFEDNVLSINHYIFGVGGIIATALISFLCVLFSWLLGLIELVPFWKVWLER